MPDGIIIRRYTISSDLRELPQEYKDGNILGFCEFELKRLGFRMDIFDPVISDKVNGEEYVFLNGYGLGLVLIKSSSHPRRIGNRLLELFFVGDTSGKDTLESFLQNLTKIGGVGYEEENDHGRK